MEQITHIQEHSEKELGGIVPDLVNQKENFSVFKLLDVLDVIRNGGVVKTGECGIEYDRTNWRLTIGNMDPFYDDNMYQRGLVKGRYRITLIMEKLEEVETE